MADMQRLPISLLLLFVLTSVVLAGCASSQPAANRLVIYSGRAESLVGPLLAQFERASGLKLEIRYGSTSELAALLLEEGANSPADLFFAQDPGGLGAVQNAGLLAQLPAALVDGIPARFVAPDRRWVGVSGRARVVVYNTDAIGDPAAELPDDLSGFADPRWAGRLGWAPTNGSFQAMVTAMRTLWGEQRTREWLTAVQANRPVVYENNTTAVAGTAAGEVDVALVNHYYLYRFLAEQGPGFKARNYFLPSGGPGSLLMVSGVGMLQSAAQKANAEQLIAYLLSAEAQQYFADQTYEYPVRPGVALPAELPPFAELDAAAAEIAIGDYTDLAGTADLLREVGILP